MSWENGDSRQPTTADDGEARLRPIGAILEARADVALIQGAPGRTRVLRVLIVDDNRDAADSLAMLMQLWGHDVRVTYRAADGLEVATAFQPDVMLLDIAMPLMDGNILAKQLRQQMRFKNTLLIAVSGYADVAHRLTSMMAGFDHYLTKPVEPSTLEKLLRLEWGRLADEPVIVRATPRTNGILIVDDDEAVRGVLQAVLRQQGFAVWLAANGQEALDLYWQQREAIDVIALALRMPVLDGPQTLAALRELNPRICCCFMSEDLGRYTEKDLRERGAAALLWKPLNSADAALTLWALANHAKRHALLGKRFSIV